jgi:hypothetical protein
VKAFKEKERHGEAQLIIKIDGFKIFQPPHWMLMYFFASFLKNSPHLWPNSRF